MAEVASSERFTSEANGKELNSETKLTKQTYQTTAKCRGKGEAVELKQVSLGLEQCLTRIAALVEVFGEAAFGAGEADEVIDFIRLGFDEEIRLLRRIALEAETLRDLVALATLVMQSRTRYCIAMTAVDEIKKQALALGVKERVQLAESLLSSLPPVAEEWSEAEELAEAERREGEIESGQVQALHDSDFWNRIEAHRRK